MQYVKALELTAYPHVMDRGWDCIEDSEGTLRIARELDDFAQAKRLTVAELAAEFWHAALHPVCFKDNPKGSGTIIRELGPSERSVIARLARLPHYDDPTETGNE